MNNALLHIIEEAKNNVFFMFIQNRRLSWLVVVWGCDAPVGLWEEVRVVVVLVVVLML